MSMALLNYQNNAILSGGSRSNSNSKSPSRMLPAIDELGRD